MGSLPFTDKINLEIYGYIDKLLGVDLIAPFQTLIVVGFSLRVIMLSSQFIGPNNVADYGFKIVEMSLN